MEHEDCRAFLFSSLRNERAAEIQGQVPRWGRSVGGEMDLSRSGSLRVHKAGLSVWVGSSFGLYRVSAKCLLGSDVCPVSVGVRFSSVREPIRSKNIPMGSRLPCSRQVGLLDRRHSKTAV